MAVHTLKPREVAERLSVSIDTVYRLIAAGELPAAKIGTFLRIPEAELDAWILRHRVSGTGELPPEITEGQRRALHAKANQLDRRDTVEYGHWKRAVLKAASEHYGRRITSANDLSSFEAGWVLDWLDGEIAG